MNLNINICIKPAKILNKKTKHIERAARLANLVKIIHPPRHKSLVLYVGG